MRAVCHQQCTNELYCTLALLRGLTFTTNTTSGLMYGHICATHGETTATWRQMWLAQSVPVQLRGHRWHAAAVGDCRWSVGDPEPRGAALSAWATPTHEEHAAQIHKAATVVPWRASDAARARAHKSQRHVGVTNKLRAVATDLCWLSQITNLTF